MHLSTNISLLSSIFNFTPKTQRAAKLGLGVSHTMCHASYWGETFLFYVLGPKLAATIHPLFSDLSTDLIFSLHSDTPTVDVTPLQMVRTAILREMKKTKEILGPKERINLLHALQAVTI